MFGLLGALPLPLVGLYYLAAIAMCVHVSRNNQPMYWMWIILGFPPLGGLAYFFAIMLPDLTGTTAARRMGQAAQQALDPGRTWRVAKVQYDEAPTVQNIMRLAEAAMGLGRWDEAEELYAQAAQGHYAEDPALLLGRARAQVELGRPAEALEQLTKLAATGSKQPQGDLIRARALQALGRTDEAEKAFDLAVERMTGLEALARQAAFLAETGRADQAKEILADLDKRVTKTQAHFRREAKFWRDFAAGKIAA